MKIGFGFIEIFPPTFYYDFMKRRKMWVGVSAVMMLLSLLVLLVKGVNYSIDFLGGTEIHLTTKDSSITRDSLLSVLQKNVTQPVEVTSISGARLEANESGFVIRVQRNPQATADQAGNVADTLWPALKKELGEDKLVLGQVVNISGKIGKEEEIKGYVALLLACVGILLYISVRFDSRFAPGAVLCLVHDVLIALGFMTFLERPFSTSSIAAFLTIVGYSINDTVIIYDRIRENQELMPRATIIEIINKSISQTMNRTVLTSATGLGALLILTFFGGGSIEDFALTMFVGILVGSYSSIYVAAPLTIMMDGILRKAGIVKDSDSTTKPVKDPNYIPPVIIRRK